MSPTRIIFLLLIFFCLNASPFHRVSAAEMEMLHLKTGEKISGHDRGVKNGIMNWELPLGMTMQVPLGEIDFIEYPPSLGLESVETKELKTDVKLTPVPDVLPETKTEEKSLEDEESLDDIDNTGLPERILNNPVQAPEIIYESFSESFEQTVETVNDWTKRLEFGGRYLSGNSNQESVNMAMRLEKDSDFVFQQHNIGGQYGMSSDVLISNRWFSNSTFDFKGKDKWVIFVKAKIETDELQKLRHRTSLSSGVGYRFFKEAKKRLVCRIGPGVTHEDFRNPELERTTPDIFGEWEFHWPLWDRVQYEHKTTVNPSLTDLSVFRFVSNYGILFQLTDNSEWSFKMGVRHDYNAQPNDNRESNDYITTVQLVYSRK